MNHEPSVSRMRISKPKWKVPAPAQFWSTQDLAVWFEREGVHDGWSQDRAPVPEMRVYLKRFSNTVCEVAFDTSIFARTVNLRPADWLCGLRYKDDCTASFEATSLTIKDLETTLLELALRWEALQEPAISHRVRRGE